MITPTQILMVIATKKLRKAEVPAQDSQNETFFCIVMLFLAYMPSLPEIYLGTTCSESEPCKAGCCNKYGNCGFGLDFCDKDACISACDAKSECGISAEAAAKLAVTRLRGRED
ncbi:hypothetical protein AJ80_09480 [Polytolypa hystricis UAMH7299]|uniref:Chitin-binding type-1 domain-containing protein n=1 Tax=Polytolypa hystricis (strain UAMH7299) TaxID=1447883 RepID=A0A2B7WQD6_POLH7|nr:hypothetical protein AJ80_09480 [Polytolypa hystricis UAMH7299]